MSCKSVGKKPRSAQLSALRRIVRDARWLLKMASPTPRCKNFPQVLKRKRVGYIGEEVSRPHSLTLLEISPGLPPAGAVGIVDPLTIATVTSMKRSSTQVLSFSQKLNALESGQRGCMRLMRNGTRSGQSCFSAAWWLRLRVKTRRLLMVSQCSSAPSESKSVGLRYLQPHGVSG